MSALYGLLEVATNIGWSLLHFLWQGTLIYLGYRLVNATVLRRASPGARYATGAAALVLMALAPVITYINLALTGLASDAATPVAGSVSVHASVIAAGNADLVARLGQWVTPLLPWAVGLWMAGVIVHALRLFAGWRYVNALRRTAATDLPAQLMARFEELRHQIGVSRPVALARSALVTVPMVIGWLRPVILMPPAAVVGLTPYQVEMILAHELAHIRRHDYLVNLFQLVVETVLFYHPAVGWLSASVRNERENCCDELVVRSGADAVRYAQALTELELLRSDRVALAIGATDGVLLARVQRLLAPPTPSPLLAVWLSGALVLGAAIAGMAGIHDVALRLGATSTDLPTMVRQELAAAAKPVADATTTKPRPSAPAAIAPAQVPAQASTQPAASTQYRTIATATDKPTIHARQSSPHSAETPVTHDAGSEHVPTRARSVALRTSDKTATSASTKPVGAPVTADSSTTRPSHQKYLVAKQDQQPDPSSTTRTAATPSVSTYTGGKPVETPKPSYPGFELVRGREGRAVLSFVVDESGRVQDVHIVSSEPSASFGIAARRAIHHWRFEPFKQDGVTVARAVTQQFDFKLPHDSDGIRCRTGSHICTMRNLDN